MAVHARAILRAVPKRSPNPAKPAPARGRDTLRRVQRDIVACERCPRLRAWCTEVARTKRRAYRDEPYWGRPVPGFGDTQARLWIVGLAPAAHGANRTGRMFTGDSSGDWLYAALHAAGFASQPEATSREDGLRLQDAYIGAVARCAPPDNKPHRDEIEACAEYLQREFVALRRLRAILCLGQIAFNATLRLLASEGYGVPRPRPRFGHRAEVVLEPPARGPKRPVTLLASYHPSRQNTHTRRLTRPMWRAVFRRARALVETA